MVCNREQAENASLKRFGDERQKDRLTRTCNYRLFCTLFSSPRSLYLSLSLSYSLARGLFPSIQLWFHFIPSQREFSKRKRQLRTIFLNRSCINARCKIETREGTTRRDKRLRHLRYEDGPFLRAIRLSFAFRALLLAGAAFFIVFWLLSAVNLT